MTSVIYSGTDNHGYSFRIYYEKSSTRVYVDIYNRYNQRVKHADYKDAASAKRAVNRFLKNK